MNKLLPLLLGLFSFQLSVTGQTFNEDAANIYVTPNTAQARLLGSWRVVIKPTSTIPAGSNIKVLFVRGFRDLQRNLANASGYVRASTNAVGAGVNVNNIMSSFDERFPAWEFNALNRVISIRVNNGPIQPGDSIIVHIGEGSNLSRARAAETAFSEEIEVAIQPGGSGPYFIMNEKPVLTVRPLQATGVYLINSAGLRTGERGKLVISAADQNFNIADRFTGTLLLEGPPASVATYPTSVTISEADSGKKEIPIVFHEEGIYKFTGRVSGSNLPVYGGNPIWVCDTLGAALYFGDIHSHGAASRDALGRDRYKYARYGRGLDFFSSADHADHDRTTFGIRADRWMEQMLEVLQYHEPGVFVSFLGLENSYNFPMGHYTVLFNFKDEDIFSLPNWSKAFYPTIQSLWQAADDEGFQILTNPHHTGKIFNRNLEGGNCVNCNSFGGIYANKEKKRMIEVYSQHGQSERYDPTGNLSYETRGNLLSSANGPYYAQNAWAIGERLGTIAGTDNHFGHPGSNPQGIAAVWADGLNRDSIFQALYDRSFYGTTGERIILHFTVNNQRQGREIVIKPWEKAHLHVLAVGTDDLEYAEVLKWDFNRGTYTGAHPNFEVLGKFYPNEIQKDRILINYIDPGFTDSCLYYVRVKQKGFVRLIDKDKEIWAWSSPVWVSHENIDPSSLEDSLLNYLPVPQIRTVEHMWSVFGEKNAEAYELYKIQNNAPVLITRLAPSGGNYSFVETSPQPGLNSYFVRIVLNDGRIKESEIKSIWLQLDSLSDWDASLENALVTMKWNGWNELYTDRYYIERAYNNGPFTTIDEQIPHEYNGQPSRAYLLFDQLSESGSYQYRLKQVLSGGEITYSETITIEFIATALSENKGKISNLGIQYNILQRGSPLILFNSGSASNGLLQVFDIKGSLLHEERYKIDAGEQQQLNLNFRSAGMYYLFLKNDELQIIALPFTVQ
jgi:hypothetical protein